MLSQGKVALIKMEAMTPAYELALVDMEHHQYSEALDILLTLCFFSPRIYELWITRGLCEMQLQKQTAAYTSFTYAAALKPASSTAYWYCAWSLQALGRHSQSKDFIHTAQHTPIQDIDSPSFIQQILKAQRV